MFTIKFLINILFGFLIHSVTNKPIEKLAEGIIPTGSAWRRLTRYAIGIVCVFFSFWLMLPERLRTLEMVGAFWSAVVGFGGGVAVGYASDEGHTPEIKNASFSEAFYKWLFDFDVKVDG